MVEYDTRFRAPNAPSSLSPYFFVLRISFSISLSQSLSVSLYFHLFSLVLHAPLKLGPTYVSIRNTYPSYTQCSHISAFLQVLHARYVQILRRLIGIEKSFKTVNLAIMQKVITSTCTHCSIIITLWISFFIAS